MWGSSIRHPSIYRKGRMQKSWKSDCSNELTSQQVNVEKKVISKKKLITHSHPGSVTVVLQLQKTSTMTTRYGLRALQCLRQGDGNSRKRARERQTEIQGEIERQTDRQRERIRSGFYTIFPGRLRELS